MSSVADWTEAKFIDGIVEKKCEGCKENVVQGKCGACDQEICKECFYDVFCLCKTKSESFHEECGIEVSRCKACGNAFCPECACRTYDAQFCENCADDEDEGNMMIYEQWTAAKFIKYPVPSIACTAWQCKKTVEGFCSGCNSSVCTEHFFLVECDCKEHVADPDEDGRRCTQCSKGGYESNMKGEDGKLLCEDCFEESDRKREADDEDNEDSVSASKKQKMSNAEEVE